MGLGQFWYFCKVKIIKSIHKLLNTPVNFEFIGSSDPICILVPPPCLKGPTLPTSTNFCQKSHFMMIVFPGMCHPTSYLRSVRYLGYSGDLTYINSTTVRDDFAWYQTMWLKFQYYTHPSSKESRTYCTDLQWKISQHYWWEHAKVLNVHSMLQQISRQNPRREDQLPSPYEVTILSKLEVFLLSPRYKESFMNSLSLYQ